MSSTYEIIQIRCYWCGEDQRRVAVDGRPPRCLKCRRFMVMAKAQGVVLRPLAKCGNGRP